jgi:hypothetical protein
MQSVKSSLAAAALLLTGLGLWAKTPMTAPLQVDRVQIQSDFAARPAGFTPKTSPREFRSRNEVVASKNVLIVQNVWPWGSDADTVVLGNIGYSYTLVDTDGFDALSPSAVQAYDIVLIPSDQDQAFYDWYAVNAGRFTQYVQNGGGLVFFVAYNGWNEGTLNAPLPGGVTVGFSGEDHNTIDDATDPIVTDELSEHVPLTNADLWGSWASHTYLVEGSLPAGAKIVFRGNDSGAPVTVRYTLGAGSVIASGNTWEYGYYYDTGNFAGKALDDVFLSAGIMFNASYYDDYSRSQFCVNTKTGAYRWNILSGAGAGNSYTGTASVFNGGAKFSGSSPNYLSVTVDPVRHEASGWFVGGGFYSKLADANTLNDPPGCQAPAPGLR